MPFSILSRRRWPFSRQTLKDSLQMKMPHTKVMCFFKKGLQRKTSDCSHGQSGWALRGKETGFPWKKQLQRLDKYYLEMNATQILTPKMCCLLLFFSPEETMCLCLHVGLALQSWCNLVWQVTVMLYFSKNLQPCLNINFENVIWKSVEKKHLRL